MLKFLIYLDWYSNVKVYCDGQFVLKVGLIKLFLNVDIWFGNYLFYIGL